MDGEGVEGMAGDVGLVDSGGGGGGGGGVGGGLGQVGVGFGLDAILGGAPRRIACAVEEASLVGRGVGEVDPVAREEEEEEGAEEEEEEAEERGGLHLSVLVMGGILGGF